MEAKQKYSRQREAIYRAICSTTEHPSAEWVYARLKPELPNLSLGTVYRNIALFREEGSIISVAVVNGQERYDGATHPHTHFICDGCGSVTDVNCQADIEAIVRDAEEQYGFEVIGHKLELHGYCPECKKLGEYTGF